MVDNQYPIAKNRGHRTSILEKMHAYKNFYLPGAVIIGALIIGGAILYTGRSGLNQTVLPPSVSQNSSDEGDARNNLPFEITQKDHIRGNPSAPITIVEFSDLECPFCKRFHPTMQRVLQEYGDKVRWVYKHFPLDQIHPKADTEAEAAECANELGGNEKFWEYIDRVFAITPSNNGLDLALLPQIAEEIGLDRAKFEACLESGKYAAHVEQDFQDGLKAGVEGTPGSFVNGQPVRGAVPYEQLKAIIDAKLQSL